MKKECPACNQMRKYFAGKICIRCEKGRERLEKREGNWVDVIRVRNNRGVEITKRGIEI